MTAITLIGVFTFLFSTVISVSLFIIHARYTAMLPVAIPAFTFLSFTIWTFYTFVIAFSTQAWAHYWALIAGQGFGMLSTGIILGRMLYQRLK